MHVNFLRFCTAAIIGFCGHATDGMAAGGTFTRGCAARDQQVMTIIETSPVSAQQKTDAVLTLLHARLMCFDGYVVDALTVYDNVAQSVDPDGGAGVTGHGHPQISPVTPW